MELHPAVSRFKRPGDMGGAPSAVVKIYHGLTGGRGEEK